MANITATKNTSTHHRSVVYVWENLNVANDVPLAVNVSHLTDFTVQVEEESAGSYTVEWHTTLDTSETPGGFIAITDALSGSAISQAASAVDECLQQGYYMKPVISGTGTVTLRLMGRRLLSA